MTQPYDIPGKLVHDTSVWKWVSVGDTGYWKLKNHASKSYNCTEYLMAKLFEDYRPAKYKGNSAYTTETDEVEEALQQRGFAASDSAELCLPPGDDGACAVLYFGKTDGVRDKEPFHVEVYDHGYGDWGGKGSSGIPIRRRKDPRSFPTDATERPNTEAVFYCKANHTDARIKDTDLDSNAREALKFIIPWVNPVWWAFFALAGFLLGWLVFGKADN